MAHAAAGSFGCLPLPKATRCQTPPLVMEDKHLDEIVANLRGVLHAL